jgi:WD40 repeat protein
MSSEQELDDFLRQASSSLGNNNSIYFEGFHHSLRENKRLEMIVKMPGCLVLAVKFYSKNLIFVSLSNGLIIQYDTDTHRVLKIFPNKGAVIDCLKILSKNYLITAGIDSKTRMWNIKSEKLFAKLEIHKYAT